MRRWPFALLVALPAVAHGQSRECTIPDPLPAPRLEATTRDNPRRLLATGGYTLVLNWSPGYCRTRQASARDRFQCGDTHVPFGFVLHGLWPDGQGEAWPQYCRPARAVPGAVIRATLCATPSVQLIQHEWSRHGTCMAPDPKRYFARSTGLYRALRFPDMASFIRREKLTTADLARAVAAANSGVPASAVRVTMTRDGWLDELWLCMDTRLRYATCRAGNGGGDATRLRITPPGGTVSG